MSDANVNTEKAPPDGHSRSCCLQPTPAHAAQLRGALALYAEGIGSVGYVAEQADIPVRVLMEEARRRGGLPNADDQLFEMDLVE